VVDGNQIADILTVGRTVDIASSIEDFIAVTNMFLGSSKAKLVLDYVQAHKVDALLYPKLTYKEYADLVFCLMDVSNKYLIDEHKESIVELPIA
jgi:hypothetical protein